MKTKRAVSAMFVGCRTHVRSSRSGSIARRSAVVASALFAVFGMSQVSAASTAYGTLNNFDCVNDTGSVAHGFDIELDDVHSKDITYTYDYNHYGVPKITEDLTDPLHPKVLVRYASAKNPDGTWAAYTAIPSGPIAPTMGHQFTDPSVNFGGEHFGVGYYGVPSAVKYNWLLDDGAGNLMHGPPVYVSTPTFVYNPPVAAAPANVVAVIVPPPPPAPPVFQFGKASWVKEIKTTTHNPGKVQLQDLVADDPGNPQPWANGEPAEVEVEWRVMQTDFNAANGGKNGELQGAPEDLPGGDEVVTRRYEFYKYVGPLDAETGEAVGDTVGPDGIHGIGMITYADHFDQNTGEWVTVTVDMSTVVVVGDFFGAQMSGFDVAPNLGLIDHVQDGEVNVAYPERTVVVPGGFPFLVATSGALPDGLSLDLVTGILSGTPTRAGIFNFHVEATDLGGANVTKDYTVTISSGEVLGTFSVGTSASPVAGGTTSGGGTFNTGDPVTVHANPNATYYFVNWTENGGQVSASADYSFTAIANRSLVANFVQDTTAPQTTPALSGPAGGGGWYRGAVQVTLSATDDLSGVATTSYSIDGGAANTYSAPFSVSGDGAHSVVFFSTDKAGNIEASQTQAVKIDTTGPSITITTPASGATFVLHQAVNAGYSASDSGSGVSSAVGTVPNGSAIDTSSLGTLTFTVNATDAAGNTSTQTASYSVGYDVSILKADVHGKKLDAEVQLVDAAGANVSSSTVALTVTGISVVSGGPAGTLAKSTGLTFQTRKGVSSYTLSADLVSFSAGTYRLNFTAAGDPVPHWLTFTVKR